MAENVSLHYKNRKERESIINFVNEGNVIDEFYWDRGHKDGPEIHKITDTGIIIIYNAKTNKLITKLIARPHQIKRYYDTENREPPEEVMEIARLHQKLGLNEK